MKTRRLPGDLGDLGGRALRSVTDGPGELVRLSGIQVGGKDVGLGAALDLRERRREKTSVRGGHSF